MVDSQAAVLVHSRRWVASRALGETLEIGIGGWPSLAFYPADAVLTGLDRQPKAVARADRAATRLGRSAAAVEGDAMALSFADASFDSVVFSFSLCGVPEVRGALLEALRVLRPGGALLMADHVVSTSLPLRAAQRVVETFTRPVFGEHFTRRPSLVARSLDIEIVVIERLGRGAIERLHATKPS
ncbi:class I SAM-dependent methyltransferase [Demequina lutea]|uniref:SAM-dependent methyltransferase n=1 Tax=Demequina lutea TaxID=431489 RepID=A0A7Y9ZC04_9MICO|nr:class I SAM-dependent methyltransferase [Demequina lutea]NYI42582.1 SAM-dependent methyltransferase [Demequina lutea]